MNNETEYYSQLTIVDAETFIYDYFVGRSAEEAIFEPLSGAQICIRLGCADGFTSNEFWIWGHHPYNGDVGIDTDTPQSAKPHVVFYGNHGLAIAYKELQRVTDPILLDLYEKGLEKLYGNDYIAPPPQIENIHNLGYYIPSGVTVNSFVDYFRTSDIPKIFPNCSFRIVDGMRLFRNGNIQSCKMGIILNGENQHFIYSESEGVAQRNYIKTPLILRNDEVFNKFEYTKDFSILPIINFIKLISEYIGNDYIDDTPTVDNIVSAGVDSYKSLGEWLFKNYTKKNILFYNCPELSVLYQINLYKELQNG